MTPDGADETPAGISVAQEALWAIAQMYPRQTPYNEAVSFRKRGDLDAAALRRAFNRLVRRYDAWHSTFDRVDGQPVLIRRPAPQFDLALTDLSALDPDAAERQAVRIVGDAARVPFDLSHGPLIRPWLLRMPRQEHRLYLVMHHLIFDGVSLVRTVLPDLIDLYAAFADGAGTVTEPARADYADLARWERRWMSTERASRRLAYWQRRLTPAPPRLDLPTEGPRPETARHEAGTVSAMVPPDAAARLRDTARAAGYTEFQALGAVWAALLSRLTGATDIAFGTPTDLRRRREFEPVVGYCLSPLVLRVDLSDDPTFSQLILRVRDELIDGLDHLVPFERIASQQQADGRDGNPIYQTMFTLEPLIPADDPLWSLHQLDNALADTVGGAKLDLELQLDARADGSFTGQLNFDRALFTRETAERVARVWRRMVDTLPADPTLRISHLPLADESDRARLAEFNATATERPQGSLWQRFTDVADRQPRAPAITAGELTISYGELRHAAVSGASRLREAGIGEGRPVGICLEPSAALLGAALAALSTGAAVLLLDPADSPESLRARASAAGCASAIIAAGADSPFDVSALRVLTWDGVADAGSRLDTGVATGPEQPCMIQPGLSPGAGVTVLSCEAVETLISALTPKLGLGPGDTVLSLPTMLYASPCTELWLGLLAGARLLLAPSEIERDGARLSRLIRTEEVTLLGATPLRWEELIASGLRSARRLAALSGGEPLSRELADRLLERFPVLWSGFAPITQGGFCTFGRVLAGRPVTVGRVLANHRAHVVDGAGQPLPVGFVGELLIEGPLAASDEPPVEVAALSSTAFGQRTARRARWLADGQLALVSPVG